MRTVEFLDTSLRDGEQTPGVNFSIKEKIAIARQLEKWGISAIEAGFPAASPDSFTAVQEIAKVLKKTAVTGLARSVKSDIDTCYEALKDAKYPQVHVFIATSPIHRKYKLNKSKEEILEAIKEHVSYARSKFEVVEFSPEDATRTELDFLLEVVQTAVDAGASYINIPDTVGFTTPEEYGAIFKYLIENVKTDRQIIYSPHCHDDLGMAVANSLAAIEGGARRIEGTVNGIGERAGNASLEEVALALYVRKDHYGLESQINLKETKKTSDLISRYAGIRVPRNKAIVGQNAFSHESGIHQDGVLKHRETYEIMTPQLVGVNTTELPLGKLSGKHAFAEKLKALGYEIKLEDQVTLFKQFKEIADKKKNVSDRDIHAIIHGSEHEHNAIFQLDNLQLQYVSKGLQSAVVVIKERNGQVKQDSSIGTGSIVAIYNAVDRIFKKDAELIDYRIDSVTEGTDAQAEVHVRIIINHIEVTGIGIDHDILKASCKAYIDAHAKYISEYELKEGIRT